MQKSLQIVALAATAMTGSVSAELKPGACPVREQNKAADTFSRISMAGLWFEYVWDPSFRQNYDYQCSTWIVLSDEADNGPGTYQIYNNMVFPPNPDDPTEDTTTDFIKFGMQYDAETEAG